MFNRANASVIGQFVAQTSLVTLGRLVNASATFLKLNSSSGLRSGRGPDIIPGAFIKPPPADTPLLLQMGRKQAFLLVARRGWPCSPDRHSHRCDGLPYNS